MHWAYTNMCTRIVCVWTVYKHRVCLPVASCLCHSSGESNGYTLRKQILHTLYCEIQKQMDIIYLSYLWLSVLQVATSFNDTTFIEYREDIHTYMYILILMYFSHFASVSTNSNVNPYEFYLMTKMNHFYIRCLYWLHRELNWQVNFIFFWIYFASCFIIDFIYGVVGPLPRDGQFSPRLSATIPRNEGELHLQGPSEHVCELSFRFSFRIRDMPRIYWRLFIHNLLISMKYMHFFWYK